MRYFLLSFAGILSLFAASCASKSQEPAPNLAKASDTYKNPYPPGTYEHFKADKSYPKTYAIWKNPELLDKTDPSNAWIRIDLATQRGMLMNGDQVVIDYPITSGNRSLPTPKGEFRVMEKIVDKRSNKYGRIYNASGKVINYDADSTKHTVPKGGKFVGASMRYWMRMTGDGVGHHVGPIRRYGASHGCVRGPASIMPTIYSKMAVGSRIVVE